MGTQQTFREMRYYRRGRGSKFFALAGAIVITGTLIVPAPDAVRVLSFSVGMLCYAPLFLTFETTVADGVMVLRVRPFWRKTIDLADVESVEITVADGQVEVFGGWNARESGVSALVAGVEGDRSVGNRAVVLHLRSRDRPQQVGSFQPRRLLAVIESQRGGAAGGPVPGGG